jgi:hypothetical protein
VRGLLSDAILTIEPQHLADLIDTVGPSRSCYSAGEDEAVGMVATNLLRDVGVRTVVVVPIRPTTADPFANETMTSVLRGWWVRGGRTYQQNY